MERPGRENPHPQHAPEVRTELVPVLAIVDDQTKVWAQMAIAKVAEEGRQASLSHHKRHKSSQLLRNHNSHNTSQEMPEGPSPAKLEEGIELSGGQ